MVQPMSCRERATEPSDAELMAAVRAGERDAFAQLVDRHKDSVVNYLTRLAGSRDRAEDLAQETFLRLYRSAATYSEQGLLQGLLFRIATNLLRSEERRERRHRLLAPLLGTSRHAEAAGPSGLLAEELHRQVGAAIAALPLDYRVPLVLHEIEGWAYADVARELGCREGTVKSRIHRARGLLRRKLAPYWHGGLPCPTSQ